MHQSCGTDSESENQSLDFNAIIKKMQGVTPLVTKPNKGIGQKQYIQAQSKQHCLVLEFFSEVVLPPQPANPDDGYVDTDVQRFTGVIVSDVEPEADATGYHKSNGVVMSYVDFADRYLTDNEARTTLSQVMFMMEESNKTEAMLMQANDVLRSTGSTRLYRIGYH